MTGDGSEADAIVFLVWVTLIPLFAMLGGRMLDRDKEDEDAPRGADEKASPIDESEGPKRE